MSNRPRSSQTLVRPAKIPRVRRGTSKAFVVKEVLTDGLLCRPLFGTGDVLVLRDYWLQRTPFDRAQRGEEWYEYSGDKVKPDFTFIEAGLYVEDNVTRTVFRYGPGRDANSNRVIESAIERVLPSYFTDDPNRTFEDGFPGIPHTGPDIIFAGRIARMTVGRKSFDWVEKSSRLWQVVSRVMLPGVLEGP